MSNLRSRMVPVASLLAMAMTLACFDGQATAATSDYPTGNSSDFATSDGGWTSEARYAGVCIQGVTCPSLTGTFESAGGTGGAGDGFISANSGTTVAALLSTSTLDYKSPAFTYNGVGGSNPDSLEFSIAINPNVTQLLNLGANVTISASIVGAGQGGATQIVIDEQSAGATPGWRTLTGTIGPNALDVGKQYRVLVAASFGGLAGVLPAGSIGIDDVTLIATRTGSGNGNGNGNGNGSGGKALPPPNVIPAGTAYLYRNKLYIRVNCPRAFKPRCRVGLTALTKKRRGKKLTPVRRASVKSGRFGRKVLGVKKPYRAKVRKIARAKKRVLVRFNIRSKRGKKHAVRYKRLKVVIRTR